MSMVNDQDDTNNDTQVPEEMNARVHEEELSPETEAPAAEEKPAAVEEASQEFRDEQTDTAEPDDDAGEANTLPDLLAGAPHPAEPSGPKILGMMLTRGLEATRSVRSRVDELYATWYLTRTTGREALADVHLMPVYVEASQGLHDLEAVLRNLVPMPVARTVENVEHVRPFVDDLFKEFGRVSEGAGAHGSELSSAELQLTEKIARSAFVEASFGLWLVQRDIEDALRELREEVLPPEPPEAEPSASAPIVPTLLGNLRKKLLGVRAMFVRGLEEVDAVVDQLATTLLGPVGSARP